MHRAKIEEARRAGREWVVLEERPRPGASDQPGYRRLELHLPTGVAVLAEVRVADDGRPQYHTESFFLNRETGAELACGSRRWNIGDFATIDELEAAVAAAKADVAERFSGMIAIYRRRQQAGR